MTSQPAPLSRRSVVRASVWGLPAVMSVTAAPAFAASSSTAPVLTGVQVRLCGKANGSRRIYEVDLTLSARADTFTATTVVAEKQTYRPAKVRPITDTTWRMTLTTDQPLATTGALHVTYVANGMQATATLAYRATDGC